MPRRVNIHHGIIRAISIEVITQKVAICSEIRGIIGSEESASDGVIVTVVEVIESHIGIVVITAISERIILCSRRTSAVFVGVLAVAPCVVRSIRSVSRRFRYTLL
jgi:hypothetical protein